MSNQKLRNGSGGGRQETIKPGPNTLCPLPWFGWRPSRLATVDGEADSPPLVQCMGAPCGFFVRTQEDGRGQCGVSAISTVFHNALGNLPSALVEKAFALQRAEAAAGAAGDTADAYAAPNSGTAASEPLASDNETRP